MRNSRLLTFFALYLQLPFTLQFMFHAQLKTNHPNLRCCLLSKAYFSSFARTFRGFSVIPYPKFVNYPYGRIFGIAELIRDYLNKSSPLTRPSPPNFWFLSLILPPLLFWANPPSVMSSALTSRLLSCRFLPFPCRNLSSPNAWRLSPPKVHYLFLFS